MRFAAPLLLAALLALALGLGRDSPSASEDLAPPTPTPRTREDARERPRLVGPVPERGDAGGTSATDEATATDARDREVDLLRKIGDLRLVAVAWETTPLASVLADLSQRTGLAFRLSPRAEASARTGGSRGTVTLAGTDLTLRAVLDCGVCDPLGLEWEARRDHVWIGLLGEGEELLARELADMVLGGAPGERAWAEQWLGSAPESLRARVAAVRPCESSAEGSTPNANPPAPTRVRVTYRLLGSDPDVLRDLGIDAQGDFPPLLAPLLPAGCRSGLAYLDDTQVEVLERLAARSDRLLPREDGSLWFWSGEERTVRLPGEGFLTLRATPSGNGRFVALRLRLRWPREGGLRFAPGSEVSIPSGGVLLVHPGDGAPWGEGEERMLLLLAAEILE